MSSLKKSFFWSAIEQMGPRVVQMLIGLVLARLLDPTAYGLVGMLALFMGLAGVFADCGLSASLIQRQDLTQDDETSVFALNVVAGVVLAGLLCAISPFVAWFYHQPVLMPMLCVQSLSTVFASFCLVQSALLARAMQFHKTAVVRTSSTVASGITGLVLAFSGFGVWSLVLAEVMASLVKMILLWRFSRWRPHGRVRRASIRSVWKFSSYLLYSNLLGIAWQNVYSVIIGKFYSPASLGFYDRANNLRMMPAGIMAGVVNRVAFPLFSRCQSDKALLLRRVREILRGTLFLSAGVLTLLAVVADPLVPLLLSEKWRPAVPLLRILCYAGALYPISALYLMALQAQGHSNLNFRIESLKAGIGLVAVLLVCRHGVPAMAWMAVALSCNSYFLNAYYNVGLLGYTWKLQALDILPTLGVCFCAGWTAWWVGTWVTAPSLVILMVRAAAFCTLCALAVFAFRRTFFSDVWKHVTWGGNQLRRRFAAGATLPA